MVPIFFAPSLKVEKLLKEHKKQRVLIFNSNVKPKQPNHLKATFSLFRFRDYDLVSKLLSPPGKGSWESAAETFILEIIDMVGDVSSSDPTLMFGEALTRVRFDLSLQGFLDCAFDENGLPKRFKKTLEYLRIESSNTEISTRHEEQYQYLTMQFSEIWSEHQARLSSPMLLDISWSIFNDYDAIVVGVDQPTCSGSRWGKEASLLLELAIG